MSTDASLDGSIEEVRSKKCPNLLLNEDCKKVAMFANTDTNTQLAAEHVVVYTTYLNFREVLVPPSDLHLVHLGLSRDGMLGIWDSPRFPAVHLTNSRGQVLEEIYNSHTS